MSESERETNPDGEIATRTPPDGAPAAPQPDGKQAAQDNGADPYAHHAFGTDAPPEQPRRPRRSRRPKAADEGNDAPPAPQADGYAPVIPLDRPSLLQDEPPPPVRIRKLRVFLVLLGLGFLA